MARSGMLSRMPKLQHSYDVAAEAITIGIDLGDRCSYCCLLGGNGEVLTEGEVRTIREGLARHFQGLPRTCIAIEVGTHWLWVNRLLRAQ